MRIRKIPQSVLQPTADMSAARRPGMNWIPGRARGLIRKVSPIYCRDATRQRESSDVAAASTT
jgi:hypothetical protein